MARLVQLFQLQINTSQQGGQTRKQCCDRLAEDLNWESYYLTISRSVCSC